jgi:SAM-dependent methyltransferase
MNKQIISLTLCISAFMCKADIVEDAFTDVYRKNFWADNESLSGPGSNLKQTVTLRKRLYNLLDLFNIQSILDAACGDFNWMKEIDYPFKRYIGIDVVQELIVRNNTLYGDKTYKFEHKNIIEDDLPKVDLIICRDCFVHLHIEDIKRTIRNFKRSGSTYVLMTTFTKRRMDTNTEIGQIGHWRTLNLQIPPFSLPEPILLLNEGCTEANPGDRFDDKCLGLWRLADINI